MAEAQEITQIEMEDLLCNELHFPREVRGVKINPLNMSTKTLVYGKPFRFGKHKVSLRVYSTILKGGGHSRLKGEGSIKVAMVIRMPDGTINGLCKDKRVHRVKGWRANLTKRVHSVIDSFCKMKPCTNPTCGLPMNLRHGSNGPFLGCTGYPNCKGTQSCHE
jgi:hypothetical protein